MMIAMGLVDLLRLLMIFGIIGTTIKGIFDIFPQLWDSAVFIGAGLGLLIAVLAFSTVSVCIFFGIKMRKLAKNVRKRGITEREKSLWSKVLAIDLASSLMVSALLSALGLGFALIGVLIAPIAPKKKEEEPGKTE